MKASSKTCDPRRLDLFLRNCLPDDFQRDVEAHLLVCPACRAQLDEMAGGPRWWTAVRRNLGEFAEPAAIADAAGARSTPSIDLSFLESSDHPSALGRLGAYEVLEVVGRGGMGVVLKSFDPALHRPVAIKVLAAEYAANGAARKRFVREAQAVAAVIHDHVVPVHAVDATATPPYLVMAFIPGQSLQQRLDRSGPLELKEILRIGKQTAAGLAAAHAQGLVHRDIKPANIMLENGIERVRITDFGLARAVDDATVTQNGAVAGTPQYMAPEQARGEIVDQRADLFALGSTLYAMCTGQAPFRGDTSLAVLHQVCDAEPASVRALNADVPIWLEGIIRKLHAKDPAQRFVSAEEVGELLERCLAHAQRPDVHPLPRAAEELGRQVAHSARPQRIRRWRPAVLALTAGVLCCASLFCLPGPAPRQDLIPDQSWPANFDDDFYQHSNGLRSRLEGIRESFAGAPDQGMGLDAALNDARQRAAAIGHDLSAVAEPGPDPVQAQLETIRRKLEELQQRIGRLPE
jgi:serine/threonine-protein kinase